MILVVYAANLLATEVIAAEKGVPSPPFDLDYLREAGALAFAAERAQAGRRNPLERRRIAA